MEVKVIATTKPGMVVDKKEFDLFGGHVAGICYMPGTFEEIMDEPEEKTLKRVELTKGNLHHSVYDHLYITLLLTGIPKLLAMLLNNEQNYTTSEKSARYTVMKPSDKELELYNKWLEIFKREITVAYPEFDEKKVVKLAQENARYTVMKPSDKELELYNKWLEIFKREITAAYPEFDEKKVVKLAQENARYLNSVATPTTMAHTVSYRQLNYLYGWMKKLIANPGNELEVFLKPYVEELVVQIEGTGYLDKDLMDDHKGRNFKLIAFDNTKRVEYFGDSYCTNYKGSFAQMAQAHRHRTLSYSITLLDEPEFFIPPIIEENKELVKEWLEDMKKVVHLYPQGMLVLINERGTYENFILKCKERLCTAAQLEICRQTRKTLLKYRDTLRASNHPLKDDIEKYTRGARCTFPDFDCPNDCHFAPGKKLERKI